MKITPQEEALSRQPIAVRKKRRKNTLERLTLEMEGDFVNRLF